MIISISDYRPMFDILYSIVSSNTAADKDGNSNNDSVCDISLLCNTCSEAFKTPWDLVVHAQSAHSMHIYEYKNDENDDDDTSLKENVGNQATSGTPDDTIITAINTFNDEIPIHQQPTEQSFLPHSQAPIIGDRSH